MSILARLLLPAFILFSLVCWWYPARDLVEVELLDPTSRFARSLEPDEVHWVEGETWAALLAVAEGSGRGLEGMGGTLREGPGREARRL